MLDRYSSKMLLLLTFIMLKATSTCFGLSPSNGIIIVKPGQDAHFNWNLETKPGISDIIHIKRNNIKTIMVLSVSHSTVTKSFENRVTFSGSFYEGIIKFTLKHIQTADVGSYTTEYNRHTYRGQDLVILGKPEKPVVKVTTKLLETENLVLNCSTESKSVQRGNLLKMIYNWYIDGSSSFRSNSRFIEETSTLQIQQITRKDSGIVIQCRAFEHEDEMSEMSEQLVLDVKYPPSHLFIKPNQLKYRLPEGNNLPDITCNSDCNPTCSYKWMKRKNDQQNNITGETLKLRNVSTFDSGSYMCIASNEFGRRQSEEILIVVANAPTRPAIIELEPPLEGQNLKLLCSSNASLTYMVDQIIWNTSRQDGLQNKRYEKLGNIFKLKNIEVIDNGTKITCKISTSHAMSPVSYPYEVVTLFGPRDISLSINITRFTVGPRDAISDINCKTQCSPECNLIWYKDVYSKVSNGNILSLGQLDMNKTGKYNCVAENLYGRTISDTIYIDMYDLHLEQNLTCAEGKSVVFVCNVVTNKKDVLFLPWLHSVNDIVLKSASNSTDKSRNTLQIPSCKMEDIGQYSCRIQINKDDQTYKSVSTDLNFLGKPRILRQKSTASWDTTSASILVHFYSVPSPENVTWLKNSRILHESEKFHFVCNPGRVQTIIVGKPVYFDGFHAQMTISNASYENYGYYILEITNEFGQTKRKIYLHPSESISIPLLWIILACGIGGTIILIISIVIFVVRRHRRRKKQLKIKVALERIRQRLAAKDNIVSRFGDVDGRNPVADENIEMWNVSEQYISSVSSASDSFEYDYPQQSTTDQTENAQHGPYEDIKSEKDSSLYDKIEEYDDTAVPALHDSSDISVTGPDMDPTNHSYTNIPGALNHPSIQTTDRHSKASSINHPPTDTALLEDCQAADRYLQAASIHNPEVDTALLEDRKSIDCHSSASSINQLPTDTSLLKDHQTTDSHSYS